ncbi:hypothetical protein VTN00DRAFT_9653 [Thermoascus crustaceus]|uniref:uncharacterized protein n=1 Tax=Thermoascus crustaceus TaxID=5088 RepID=UPI003744683C
MPIAYSTTAGAKDPDRALWIDEYVALLDAGLLFVFDRFYGFKAYLSKDQLDLSPDQCIELVHKDLPAGLDKFRLKKSDEYRPLSISCADYISRLCNFNEPSKLAVVSDQSVRTKNTHELSMSNPTLQVNGRDPATPEGTSGVNSTINSTRKSLHQNIIGKLRPLPFQYHWTVWHDKHSESANYENRLYILHEDVADIATFYRVYNNYPWDKVRLRDSVHIFRKGVKPVWEDPENLKGGCWTFRVPKSKAQAFFHEIAILCMANEFQAALEGEHDHVLGVSTSVRFNSHLISVWNKSGSNQRAIKALEDTILDRLSPELRPAGTNSYFYKRHEEHDGFQKAVEATKKRLEEGSGAQ